MNFPILSDTYEIREQIGSGGGGIIYKAWHVRLQKEVVLKKLRLGAAGSLATQRAEADILKGLKHSYLPQLYDFLIEDGDVYTVMEFIDGQSFDKLLTDGRRYSQQEVIKWAGQLCEALTYLHKQTPPILHSDIKPANMMLTNSGDMCLIDFNISLLLGDDGAVAVGRSHGYASPEQYSEEEFAKAALLSSALADETQLQNDAEETVLIESAATTVLLSEQSSSQGSDTSSGKRQMDVRSDIYSLGATLYHLLTGEKPSIATGAVKPLDSFGLRFSEGIVYIVEKAMNPDAAQRFQSAAEMLHAVKNIRRLDYRWKMQRLQNIISVLVLAGLFCAFTASAVGGYLRMGREKLERYDTAVLQLEEATDITQAEQLFSYAVGLFPEKIGAYHANAYALWRAGEYADCKAFIEKSLISFYILPEDEKSHALLGDMYFILANCYFEEEDYANAAVYYKSAVESNADNAEYYRDYAVALARLGNIPEAEQLLLKARQLQLGGDSLELLQGEIAYAKGEYKQAAQNFKSCILATRDGYMLYRAYRICADSYMRQNDFHAEIDLLNEAIAILPQERKNEITERLADAYVRGAESGTVDKSAYYQQAAELFVALMERGYQTFQLQQNLAILYQQIEDFDSAEELLLMMQEDYPNDYRVPMRLAYLYADKQAQLDNENRDYTDTRQSYEKAKALYEAAAKDGKTDPELLMLEDMLNQLAQGGWFK